MVAPMPHSLTIQHAFTENKHKLQPLRTVLAIAGKKAPSMDSNKVVQDSLPDAWMTQPDTSGVAKGVGAKVRTLTLARLRANEPIIHRWQDVSQTARAVHD